MPEPGAVLRLTASSVAPPNRPKGAELWIGGRRAAGPDAPRGEGVHLTFGPSFEDGWAREDAVLWRWSGAALGEALDPVPAQGLLCNFMNIVPAVEDEFADWYETEHLPRLRAVPGVLTAARYRSEGSPRYLAVYRLADPEAAQGAAWLEAARTPWSARIRRFTRDYQRFSFAPYAATRGERLHV